MLALANKESLIVGGPLVKALAKPGQIIPVDSEHSALFQALAGGTRAEVRKLVVTASGGPFRGRTKARAGRRHARAGARAPHLGHGPGHHRSTPRPSSTRAWRSSRRICSTTSPSTGSRSSSTRSRTSTRWWSSPTAPRSPRPRPPDMRVPIASASAGPSGSRTRRPRFDWTKASTWEFFPLDNEAFPSVALARHVGQLGGTAPAVFNAANEECVDAFLARTAAVQRDHGYGRRRWSPNTAPRRRELR